MFWIPGLKLRPFGFRETVFWIRTITPVQLDLSYTILWHNHASATLKSQISARRLKNVWPLIFKKVMILANSVTKNDFLIKCWSKRRLIFVLSRHVYRIRHLFCIRITCVSLEVLCTIMTSSLRVYDSGPFDWQRCSAYLRIHFDKHASLALAFL